MQEWKQAYTLAKLELKASKLGFLLAYLFSVFILSVLVTSLESYMDNGYVGFDFFFILLFTFAPVWAKPKDFQIQKLAGDFMASPVLVMQRKLPIRQEVIIKSRFIIHFFYSFPPQLLVVITLYFLSPLEGMLSLGSFIAFSILWLSFGVYTGYGIPASDAGEKGLTTSTTAMVFIGIMILVVSFVLFTIIHVVFGNGIVYWSIIFAQKWPLLSAIVSIVLALLGFNYWQRYMKKTMEKIDYL